MPIRYAKSQLKHVGSAYIKLAYNFPLLYEEWTIPVFKHRAIIT
jgi:hypothetical protein